MKPEDFLRPAKAEDQPAIVQLIGNVLAEYGETICLEPDGAEADLLNLEDAYRSLGGEFWVLVRHATVLGTHAALPRQPDGNRVCVLKRLYLDASERGGGAGRALMDVAIRWAREHSFREIEFWSDCRFLRAHRFFEKTGFQSTGAKRVMNDSFQPYEEIQFRMILD